MANGSRSILVAGGGIAGICTALCLAKRGFRVELFEQAEGFESVGAGLQIPPNALRVLEWLGIEQRLKLVATGPASIRIISGRSGRQITSIPLGENALRRYGKPYLVVHRADLLQTLIQAVADKPDIKIHMSSRVEDVSEHARGVTALVYSRGEMNEFHGAGLVAADGVWSRLRERRFGLPPARYSGITAWRAMVSASQLPGAQDLENTRLHLSPDGHLVCYPVRAGRYLNIVALAPADLEDGNPQHWTTSASSSEIHEKFANWHKDITSLFKLRSRWTRWPLYTCQVPGHWNKGKTVLAGDAAHAMLPFAAQGAAMAIEDAHELAATLARERGGEDAVERAFAAFSRSRVPRVRKAVRLTNTNRRIYHLKGPLDQARNLAMMAAGGGLLLSRQDWLYGWQPSEVEVPTGRKKA